MHFHHLIFLFLSLAVFATEDEDLHEQSVRFFKIVQEIKIIQVKRDPASSNNNNKFPSKIPFVRILRGILHPCDFAQLPAQLINDFSNDAKAGAGLVSQIVNGQNPTILKSLPSAIAGEVVEIAKELPKVPEEILNAIEEGVDEAGSIISQIANGQVPTQLKSIGGAIVTAAKNIFNDIGNAIDGKKPTSTSKKSSTAGCVRTTAPPQNTVKTTTVAATRPTTTFNSAAAAASSRSVASVSAAYSSYYRASSSLAAAQSAARASAARVSASAWSSYYKASSSYYAAQSAARAAASSRSATLSTSTLAVPNSFTIVEAESDVPAPIGVASSGDASTPTSNSATSSAPSSANAQAASTTTSTTTAAPSSIGAARPKGYIAASLAGLIGVLGLVLLL